MCAHTLWNDLEKRYPNYSLQNLDEILHKTIAFHKMKPTDPNFHKCLFELRDFMRPKGDVTTINNIIIEAIHIHKLNYCHGQNSNKSLGFYDDEISTNDDNEEH